MYWTLVGAAVEMDERIAQPEGAVTLVRDLELEAGEVHGRRDDVQPRHRGLEDGVADVDLAGEHVVGRAVAALAVDAEPGRGIALRVEIDDQHMLADRRERGAEIDGGRGLADPALLVGEGEHPGDRGRVIMAAALG